MKGFERPAYHDNNDSDENDDHIDNDNTSCPHLWRVFRGQPTIIKIMILMTMLTILKILTTLVPTCEGFSGDSPPLRGSTWGSRTWRGQREISATCLANLFLIVLSFHLLHIFFYSVFIIREHSWYLSQPSQPAVVYFFQAGVLFSIETATYLPILASFGYFVANLRNVWCTFYRHK